MPGAEDPQKVKCAYCGNNPVPHFLTWYQESLSLLLQPLRQRLLFNFITRWLRRKRIGQGSATAMVGFFSRVGILSLQERREQCKIRRAQVLWEEAEKRGIKIAQLLLFGKPLDIYIAEKHQRSKVKGQRLVFSGLPRPADLTSENLELMDDKAFLKSLFSESSLPVPAGGCVTSFWQAKRIFQKIEKPAIVKPRSGSRSRHSTTFVYTENDLRRAFKIAKQLCHWVIVEEQLQGPVFRATVIDFKLTGVLRGDSPSVMGDGTKSILQLIELKNSAPHPGVKNITVDPQMELFVSRQDLSLTSVPAQGQAIILSEKIGVNYGGSSSEDFEICHSENKELFERAAKIVGDPIVGFDFIIPDITKCFKEQKCGFIEANSLPFINLHHDPLLGQPRNAAAAIWDMMGW